MTKCDQCGKFIGWHSEKHAAVAYATPAGPVPLCSVECDEAWIASRQPKEEAKPK